MFQNFHLFGNDLAIQYTVVTRIETRVTKTPGETFVPTWLQLSPEGPEAEECPGRYLVAAARADRKSVV